MNAQIPKTYYLVNANAYRFTIVARDGSSVLHTYVFDATVATSGGVQTYGYGNYSSLTWLTALNDEANWTRDGTANSKPGTWYIGAYNRKYRLDLSTAGRGEYFATTACGISEMNTHLARYMGFPTTSSSATLYASSVGASVALLEAPNAVNFTLTNVVNVCCSVGREDAPAAKGNCIGRVYMSGAPFGTFETLFNTNPYETSRTLLTKEQGTKRGSGHTYRLVQFALVDDDGQTIELNGGHVVMGIYTYARASLYELVRRTANVFSEVAQEARQLGAAQLRTMQRVADKPVAPIPGADMLI